MIRLKKIAAPGTLTKNAEAWTKNLLDKIAAGEQPTAAEKARYRHPDIKAALVQETHGKCAYCESKLLHIHHGDVEHVYPKSLDPARTFEWDNLTLACEVCNQNKSNKDPLVENIIDPYHADPSDHLLFFGPLIFPSTPAGISTRALLDLNRGELCERRKEKLEGLMMVYETLTRGDLPLPTRRAIFLNLVQTDAAPSAPYSAMARQAIALMKGKLPAQIVDGVAV